MKCILLFIILAINVIDAKSALKKSMLKVKMHLKLKAKNHLKLTTKGDVWSPTGTKRGNPNNKTGTDWCTSTDDGPSMTECVKFWNPSTWEVKFNYKLI